MVPTLVHEIGSWIDRFSESLNRWESVLVELRSAYLRGDQEAILELCRRGEEMQEAIANDKQERLQILERAGDAGYRVSSLKELSQHLDTAWPALWTHRIQSLENQLLRIEQLSVSLWVSAFQAREFVSDMIRILSTGRVSEATYSPSELTSSEGGYLVNEAA
ncbi:MAG: hypothetical protein ACK6DC_20365 [Planctomycetota bacterium]|jgi:hypothetical protein